MIKIDSEQDKKIPKWTVYVHTNKINGKKYVGITCLEIKKRWGENGSGYLRKTNGKYNQPAIANAIVKYGWDNFEHEIVAENLDKEDAENMEADLIKKYKSNIPRKGYNIREGGGSHGHLSEETKEKLRKTMEGRYVGKKNPFYGRKHTQEVKDTIARKAKERAKKVDPVEMSERMSRVAQGTKRYKRKHNLETEEEKLIPISKEIRGPMTKETKNKISDSLKDYYSTHEHHAKGTHKTDEQKEHIRKLMLGREMDEEWRQKIGRGHAKYIYGCVETGKEYLTSGEAMKDTGIDKASIRRAADGIQKIAGGMHWYKREKV